MLLIRLPLLLGLARLLCLLCLAGGFGLTRCIGLPGRLRLTGGLSLGLRLAALGGLAGGFTGLVGPAGVVRLALPLLGHGAPLGVPFRRALVVAICRSGSRPAGFLLLLLLAGFAIGRGPFLGGTLVRGGTLLDRAVLGRVVGRHRLPAVAAVLFGGRGAGGGTFGTVLGVS